MAKSITYVGLDVHAETIAVGLAEAEGEVRFYGTIPNTAEALRKLTAKLSKSGAQLEFCYEAGPCGYGVQRALAKLGFTCLVVSPSLLPRRPGDRIKTDRRDALMLSRLLRSGDLEGIWVPDEEHEAMRDLVRSRRQSYNDLREAKQKLCSFLLRHGLRFPGKSNWTKAYWRWLGEQKAFAYPHQQQVLEEYKHHIRQIEARCERIDATMEEAVRGWHLRPVVEALQALRGIGLIVATTIVAEIGDLRRFSHPRQLMAWLGLVPCEHSSGAKTRRGGITKSGNALARTMLIEAGWSYRLPARQTHYYMRRIAPLNLPEPIKERAWTAQVRLCRRYRHLALAGKPTPKVVTAIARALAGFVWDIACRVCEAMPNQKPKRTAT